MSLQIREPFRQRLNKALLLLALYAVFIPKQPNGNFISTPSFLFIPSRS